jgi:hypothetical protein
MIGVHAHHVMEDTDDLLGSANTMLGDQCMATHRARKSPIFGLFLLLPF